MKRAFEMISKGEAGEEVAAELRRMYTTDGTVQTAPLSVCFSRLRSAPPKDAATETIQAFRLTKQELLQLTRIARGIQVCTTLRGHTIGTDEWEAEIVNFRSAVQQACDRVTARIG